VIWILVAVVVWMIVRARLQRGQSEHWPEVQGTIAQGEAIVTDAHIRTLDKPAYQVTRFEYAYGVDGREYTGSFALPVYPLEAVDVLKWHQELGGRSVSVRYDPKNPGTCFLAESEFLGKRIYQYPDWRD
jgi:hypothetical protein